nr:MAG TPA: hypothetical protein [Caudoviricetes sp.]
MAYVGDGYQNQLSGQLSWRRWPSPLYFYRQGGSLW